MPFETPRRAVLAFLSGLGLAPAAFAQGGATLIARRESPYNTIYVVRTAEGRIAMIFGVNRTLYTESLYDPQRPRTLPVEYTRAMTAALAFTPQARSILEIGLGGGRTAFYLHQHMPATNVICVELDPAVIELALAHFGIRQERGFSVVQRDGRIYLNQNAARHDIILVDAYRGTFVPFHLLTQQFFQTVKRRLVPGGVMAQNIEPTTMLYDSAIATIRSVFQNVDTIDGNGNVVAIAYDGPRKTDAQLLARARALQQAHSFAHPLPDLLRGRRSASAGGGRVLTDDFAPVESLRAIERNNQRRPTDAP